MRILVVSSWYPPIQSGSSFWAESLVTALRQRGHDVRVVTTTWPGAPADSRRDRPEVVYRLPAWVLPRNRLLLGLSIVPIANSSANRRRMLAIVEEFRPDVIHQINHIFDTLFLSAYAARKTGTPLVGSITTPIQSQSPLIHALMNATDNTALYHFGIRHWRAIICSDSEQARYALDTYGAKAAGRVVTHIHVGLHQRVSQLVASAGKAPWPQIVSVGHVHAIRDPTNLIRAMPAVLRLHPTARLDIAGRVQFQRPVRAMQQLGLEGAVRFLGEVRQDELADLMARAHLFAILHQCRYAGLSFTAIEAMHFGIPVLINAPADLYGPGVVRDGENILLVNGGDVEGIAQRMIDVLGDPARQSHIGRAGKRLVSSVLDWDVCAARTEELYGELCREPSPSRRAA
jgi:glycosyltransferase involved in cell wall biosynthesis